MSKTRKTTLQCSEYEQNNNKYLFIFKNNFLQEKTTGCIFSFLKKCCIKAFSVHQSHSTWKSQGCFGQGTGKNPGLPFELDLLFADPLLKGGQGGVSKFCTIPLVGMFCLGGILTFKVMAGHAFNAWTNLFIINNLFSAGDM